MTFWTGADEMVGGLTPEMHETADAVSGPTKKRRGTMTNGYKHRKFWTPAGEPTPATQYMRAHSMTTGDPLLAYIESTSQGLETPEKNLMFAVLIEAIKDFTRHWNSGKAKGGIFREARDWIWPKTEKARRDAKDWPHSFRNICNALDLDGDDLSRRLGLWLVKKREEQRGWIR